MLGKIEKMWPFFLKINHFAWNLHNCLTIKMLKPSLMWFYESRITIYMIISLTWTLMWQYGLGCTVLWATKNQNIDLRFCSLHRSPCPTKPVTSSWQQSVRTPPWHRLIGRWAQSALWGFLWPPRKLLALWQLASIKRTMLWRKC